jgi:hypothetical protein
MGPAGLFEHPGDKELPRLKDHSADRADPLPLPFKTVGTPGDMHKPVYLSHGRKGGGLYPFSPFKQGGTDRTGPRGAGNSLPQGALALFPGPAIAGPYIPGTKEKAVPKPEK